MQKRYYSHLPEVYVDLPPLSYGAQTIPNAPVPLDVFEVTYLHYHRHLELGYCVSGECVSYVDGKSEPCKPGDIVIIFPFQRHISCNSTKEFSQWNWAYIDLISLFTQSGIGSLSHLNRIIQTEMGICGVLDQQKYPQLAAQARLLLEDNHHTHMRRHGQEQFALNVYSFLLMLSDASADLPKLHIPADQRLPLIAPALDMISRCLDQERLPSIEELSGECRMCQSYFRRVFHQVVGVSPKEYVNMSCMRKATLLLTLTKLNVMEIAMHCGYREISSFNRSFLKATGLTPSQYRRRYRNSEVPASTGGVLPSGLCPYEGEQP